MLNLTTEGRVQPLVEYHSKDSQDTTQGDRLYKGYNGRGCILPGARESRHIVPGGGGSMSLKTARSASEAIGNLKNGLEQGMAIDSLMYVEVLRRCSKEENLNVDVAKQVHDYINQSGMEQNPYVANNLVSVYIRCGELEDTRGVFDKLVNRKVFSWTIMIGGYAEYNHADKAMELFNHAAKQGSNQMHLLSRAS